MNLFKGILIFLAVGCISCNSNKKATEVTVEEGMAKALSGKLLVTLLEGKKVEVLEASFAKYDLKHKSIASKSQNQHLFTFNKNKISDEDLLKKLNRNKVVYLAEPLSYEVGKPQKFSSGKKAKVPVK